jgi:hypothetical protein
MVAEQTLDRGVPGRSLERQDFRYGTKPSGNRQI